MTERKTKPKAATRSIARKIAKPAPAKRSAPASPKSSARSATKHDRIIAMLRTSAGATIAALVTATEWQQHSVRSKDRRQAAVGPNDQGAVTAHFVVLDCSQWRARNSHRVNARSCH
jgi:hypothetical protein